LDTLTFQQAALKVGERLTDNDPAIRSDYAMPRDPFASRAGRHGPASCTGSSTYLSGTG